MNLLATFAPGAEATELVELVNPRSIQICLVFSALLFDFLGRFSESGNGTQRRARPSSGSGGSQALRTAGSV